MVKRLFLQACCSAELTEMVHFIHLPKNPDAYSQPLFSRTNFDLLTFWGWEPVEKHKFQMDGLQISLLCYYEQVFAAFYTSWWHTKNKFILGEEQLEVNLNKLDSFFSHFLFRQQPIYDKVGGGWFLSLFLCWCSQPTAMRDKSFN